VGRTIHKLLKLSIFRLLISSLALILFFSFSFLILWIEASSSQSLIETFRNRHIPQTTLYTDSEGNILYESFLEERRTLVPLAKINVHLQQAIIAAEDKNFYKHVGVDPTAIFRATVNNLNDWLEEREDSNLQGGSTITQQLVKNTLLDSRKTIQRKVQEAILAFQLELNYSKDKILESYLNQVGFGNQAFGAQEAAKTYFNKEAKDLTLAESALLAALPQLPSFYSPFGNNQGGLFSRKDYILDQMVELGYITDNEANEAKATAPNKSNPDFFNRTIDIKAPHVVWSAKDEVLRRLGGDQSAEKKLSQSGYVIKTTIEPQAQKLAEDILHKYQPKLNSYGATNASLIAIDVSTGNVLALVGSLDYFNSSWGNVNVASRPRQPGSAFKPIVYTAAFNEGYTPNSVLDDAPVRFILSRNDIYEPKNYDNSFRGRVTIAQALNLSLNIPAVKVLADIGSNKVATTATTLGLTTLPPEEKYGLSMALGAYEVRLDELTNAYSILGNNGRWHEINYVQSVESKKGFSIEELSEVKSEDVYSVNPTVAYDLTKTLADSKLETPVFGNSLKVDNREVAVKTGTSQDFKDAWTVGYTPQIAVGVWVGNNNGKPLYYGAPGALVAAPIWREFMQQYLSDKPVLTFNEPSNDIIFTAKSYTPKIQTEKVKCQNSVKNFINNLLDLNKDCETSSVAVAKTTDTTNTAVTPVITDHKETQTEIKFLPLLPKSDIFLNLNEPFWPQTTIKNSQPFHLL